MVFPSYLKRIFRDRWWRGKILTILYSRRVGSKTCSCYSSAPATSRLSKVLGLCVAGDQSYDHCCHIADFTAGSTNRSRPSSWRGEFDKNWPGRWDDSVMSVHQNGGHAQEIDMNTVITEINAVLADPVRAPPQGPVREAELRRCMLEIQNDHRLSSKEKAQRMQDLMVPKRPASRNSELSRSNSTARSPNTTEDEQEASSFVLTEKDRAITYHVLNDSEDESCHGCAHYRTNCKIRAECCGNWYSCRFCHDESEDHAIDRHAVKFMLCMQCQVPQNSAKSCRSCLTVMANYYCDICKLWDDDPEKEIYHCQRCKICRRGKSEDFVHCDRCCGCISSEHYPQHKCLEGSLQSNCPICGENLFTSTSMAMFMPCGHSIHYTCHQEHTRSSYQCPICLKSLNNMSLFFTRIDELMASQQMPEEYRKMSSQILCNDCEKKSVAKFHFIYHRCAHCASYNTKLIRTFNEDEPPGTAAPIPPLAIDAPIVPESLPEDQFMQQ